MRLTLYIFIVLLAIRCEKEKTISCPTVQTLQNFSWIQNIIKDHPNDISCSLRIYIGVYKGDNVIFWDYTGPACDTAGPLQLYNCDGDTIKIFVTTADFKDRQSNLMYEYILY